MHLKGYPDLDTPPSPFIPANYHPRSTESEGPAPLYPLRREGRKTIGQTDLKFLAIDNLHGGKVGTTTESETATICARSCNDRHRLRDILLEIQTADRSIAPPHWTRLPPPRP